MDLMTPFVKIARIEDIPPGGRLFYEFAEETVLVVNVDGRFYCIADLCTHDNGPLENGDLLGCEITCPRHGARFDVRTGAVLSLPATRPIPTYPVKIENGDIYIQPPDPW